jgi:hypothetical protein
MSITELIEQMPPHLQREVQDFAQFIAQKHMRQVQHQAPQLTWRGALESLRPQYTSVDLQHEALQHWK